MKPNFLVFCTDQMQSFSMGCNGNDAIRTPNLDAIAGDGVTFRRAYCNNNVCMPSRATMITGMTPRQHGLLTNGCCLPDSVPTLTQALVEQGYRTHAVGKLHLQPFGAPNDSQRRHSWESRAGWTRGEIDSLPSPYYGFQTTDFVGGHVNYVFGDYQRWLDEHHPGTHERYAGENAYARNGRAWRMDVPPEAHYNHWIADRTVEFLNGIGSDEPFFLWCSFPDPHFPYAACRPYSEMYDPADVPLPPRLERIEDPCPLLEIHRRLNGFDQPLDEGELREITAQTWGMISQVDHNVGRVMDALRDRGLDESTVVVVMADHGEYLGTHNLLHKGVWPYEELMRVPCIWRAPGARPRSHVNDDTVSLLDFTPTVADYAGVDTAFFDTRGVAPEHIELPGRSLRPYLEGDAEVDERPALLEFDGDWQESAPVCRMRGIVHGDWKLAIWAGFEEGLLVNVAEDPGEIHNLWDDPAHAEVKSDLMRRLLDRVAYSARFDTPRISGA